MTMKQEPQERLLKDICARLPYGIKASYCELHPPKGGCFLIQ